MVFWHLQPIVLVPLIGAISAVCTGAIARYSGRKFWPSFVGGFFLGPLAVLFAFILFVPKRWRGVRW